MQPGDGDALLLVAADACGVGTDGGARLTVWINGEKIGAADLTNVAPFDQIKIQKVVSYSGTAHIEIRNEAAFYSGNDFAIDNISLTQH